MAWNPRGNIFASQSSDRSVRIYKRTKGGKKAKKAKAPHYYCCNALMTRSFASTTTSTSTSTSTASEATATDPTSTAELQLKHKLFLDETIHSYVVLYIITLSFLLLLIINY